MPVERVDYSNDEEYQNALAMEEEQGRAEWEAQQNESDAAQAQFEADCAGQAEAEAQQAEECPPEEIPF